MEQSDAIDLKNTKGWGVDILQKRKYKICINLAHNHIVKCDLCLKEDRLHKRLRGINFEINKVGDWNRPTSLYICDSCIKNDIYFAFDVKSRKIVANICKSIPQENASTPNLPRKPAM